MKRNNTVELNQKQMLEQFKNTHGDKYIYDKAYYKDSSTKVLIGCRVESHGYFEQLPSSHRNGSGCPICGGKVLHDGNRLSVVRPDLVKYFANQEDANKYAVSSSKKVQLVCPECGKEKSKCPTINGLSSRGFSCEYCSTKGFSVPERFMNSILMQLNIKFEKQYIPSWSMGKKYDFYISSLNVIIETHGAQHYEGWNRDSDDLIRQKENDKLKYNLAIENGFLKSNYIIIDCRKVEFKILATLYNKALSKYYDLSNIDWTKAWEDCQKSIVSEVWKAWNNRDLENDSTTTVAEIFELNRNTVIGYLKRGNEIGMCIYDGEKENSKNSSRVGKLRAKPIYQYSLEGIFIKEWNSATDAGKSLNIGASHISSCCTGGRKSSGGFMWSHLNQEDFNEQIEKYKRGTNAKISYQYTLELEFVSTWDSTWHASKTLSISQSSISNCCNGKNETAGGFKWSYEKVETLRKE